MSMAVSRRIFLVVPTDVMMSSWDVMSAKRLSVEWIANVMALTSRVDTVVFTPLIGCMAAVCDITAEDQFTREGVHIYRAA